MKRNRLPIIILCLAMFALSFGLVACAETTETPEPSGYKLTYAKGAYAATGEVAAEWHEEGDEVTLADAAAFALSGYTLDVWSDGTDEYVPGSTFIMPAHDVTLTAKWIQGDPNAPVVTAQSVGFEDGYFVLSGTVENVEKLYVYLNNTGAAFAASNEYYVEAEISANGSFTVRYSLDKLISYNGSSSTPFNLRYRIDSTTATINGISKGSLDLSATYYYNERNFRLAVNSGTNCVSVYYAAAPDPSVVVTATNVAFDEGYFVVTGTVENVEKLYVYLINTNHSATLDNYVEATVDGGDFTARLSLDALVEKGGVTNDPFNLRYRANNSQINVNIPQGALDLTKTHSYDGNDFRLGVNGGCVAVYYKPTPNPDYSVTASSMSFNDGRLIIEGDCGASVEKIVIHLNKSDEGFDLEFEATIASGEFSVEIPLADIKKSDDSDPPTSYINIRYERNDEPFSTANNFVPGEGGNADYAVNVTHEHDGKIWTLKADANRTYLTWEAAPALGTPVVTAESIAFDGGYFVFTGEVENVETLYVYLINTNVSGSLDNYVEAEIENGEFTAHLSLDALIGYGVGREIPFNLRYKVDDPTANTVNVAQGSLDITLTHTYNGKAFRLGINSGCVAVYYETAFAPDYTISVADMRFEDGKFIVEGECGASIETLIFHLNNTSNPAFDLTFAAEIEGGEFCAEILLSEIKRTDGSNAPSSYINVRYEMNENGFSSNNNLLPVRDGDFFVGASCKDGDKLWTLHADATRTYLNWTAAPTVEGSNFVVYTMYFGNGKFIIEGGCGSEVNKLIIHMHNTNSPIINCTFEAAIADGTFKVEVPLSDIKNANDAVPSAGTYINVRYELNDDGFSSNNNLLPDRNGPYTADATYTNDGKTWTVVADSSRTYIKWAAA